jgi:hypothetical protein
MDSVSFSFVIISLQNSNRLDRLVDQLRQIGAKNIHILAASRPSDIDKEFVRRVKNISSVEQAIALSHHRARVLGNSLESDWVIILEEDASPTSNFQFLPHFLAAVANQFGVDRQVAVHFAPEQFGLLINRRSSTILRTFMLADCAVAYGLNQEALKHSMRVEFKENEVADWPRFIKRFLWISPLKPIFSHPDLKLPNTYSATSEMREKMNFRKGFMRKLFKFSNFKFITFLIISSFGNTYGNGYVTNERSRSKVISL